MNLFETNGKIDFILFLLLLYIETIEPGKNQALLKMYIPESKAITLKNSCNPVI